MNKHQAIQAAKDLSTLLQTHNIPLTGLYLFGSYAKGTNHKWSDIDIGVISPYFGKDRMQERKNLMKHSEQITVFIEPHPFSPSDFDDRYNLLAQEVKKTGIKIV